MTFADKRAQAINSAHAGDLKPLCELTETLRAGGTRGVTFDYNDLVSFLTRCGECTEQELEDWWYEMDRNPERYA